MSLFHFRTNVGFSYGFLHSGSSLFVSAGHSLISTTSSSSLNAEKFPNSNFKEELLIFNCGTGVLINDMICGIDYDRAYYL